MKNILLIGLLLFVWSCKDDRAREKSIKAPHPDETKIENVERIKVLNFGTFHMGLTTDANTTKFNERDKENQKKIHEIAMLLSRFKPTVILVETTPEYDQQLQSQYSNYLENPNMYFKNPSEVELLAFELGRLSNTQKIASHTAFFRDFICRSPKYEMVNTFEYLE